MNTDIITPETLSNSVIAVPPLARDADLNVCAAETAKIMRHLEAGGIRAYERQHRTTLAHVLNRGTRLPADVIPKIVDYWAHLGWYQYTQ